MAKRQKRVGGKIEVTGQSGVTVEERPLMPAAPTPAGILMGPRELCELRVDEIIPTPDNPRFVNGKLVGEDSAKFAELLESIGANGVIEPVHVRPHPTQKGKSDLRDGARRWRAAQLAGIEKIPAFLYPNMSDLAAFLLTMLQTLGREDLTPMQESVSVGRLLERCDGDVRAAAAYTGHTAQWVRLRARLQELSPSWQQAMAGAVNTKNGWEFVRTWTVGHYELIARLPAETQDVIWTNFQWQHNAPGWSVKDLDKYLAGQVMHLLVTAPWAKDDAELVPKHAGVCCECLKRSSCQGELFHEGEQPDVIAKRDRCLDAACWDARSEAYTKASYKKLREQHPNLQLLATQYPGYYEEQELKKKFGDAKIKIVEDGRPCKADAPGAVPGLVVHGKGTGQVVWLKPETKATRTAGALQPRGKSLTEKREQLDSRRWASVIEVIKERLDVIKFVELPAHTLPDLLKLVNGFGTDNVRLVGGDWKAFDAKVETPVLAEKVWQLVAPRLSVAMCYTKPAEVGANTIVTTKRIALLLGMESDAMFEAATLRLPDPKSWKKLAEEEAAIAEKALPKKSKKEATGRGGKAAKLVELYHCRECDKQVDADEHDGWPEDDLCPECEEQIATKEQTDQAVADDADGHDGDDE